LSKYRLLGVYREKRFSPGMVEKDAAVLRGVLERLLAADLPLMIESVEGEKLPEFTYQPDFVLTMAQSSESLGKLDSWNTGTRIINSVRGVRNCYREAMISILRECNAPCPDAVVLSLNEINADFEPVYPYPVWLKRSDVHAMSEGDVVKVRNKEELSRAIDHFGEKGIKKIVVQKHVEGRVFKFYGVGKGDFFRVYSQENEELEDYNFVSNLKKVAFSVAEALELEIFGGDAVLDQKERIHIIDMNDWPSFSACCNEAAEAIFQYVTNKWKLV